MTTLSDPPKPGFRPSQLIYDTRYRSMTIQTVAFILLMAAIFWLVSNTIENLNALGKDFNFGFLGQPAGYDINQRLIEYDSQASHGRAALVGILNTLLVAVLGCVAATIVGVIAGVLRLSKNWIVSRLMSVYVEGFRNVPLLLWIVLIFAVFNESTPQPRDFRGEDPAASMILGDTVAITNRGTYIPEPLFSNGLGDVDVKPGWIFSDLYFAVSIDLVVIVMTIVASILLIRLNNQRAHRIQNATGVRPTTWWVNLLVFFVPLGALLWVLGFHLGYPELKGFNFSGGTHIRNSLMALWLALTLYTGAFIAEIVRGGILAINKGQTEAAFALGLRPGKTMNLVILPQAMRVIIPPLISQYLNLTKNSSLAIAVGYMDVRATLGGITINQTGRELEGMLLLGLFYLILSLLISGGMNLYNNSVKLKER
ncbi:amino acid ABC transporter permease [Marivivens marinus]|uniref:amino acid ABC transporter permease n=1 Tax=Marivivens marinus TaxID=3110173 RepID=UPI003B849863